MSFELLNITADFTLHTLNRKYVKNIVNTLIKVSINFIIRKLKLQNKLLVPHIYNIIYTIMYLMKKSFYCVCLDQLKVTVGKIS